MLLACHLAQACRLPLVFGLPQLTADLRKVLTEPPLDQEVLLDIEASLTPVDPMEVVAAAVRWQVRYKCAAVRQRRGQREARVPCP